MSEYEVDHGRPMLSAIVVRKDERRLGSGFYQLGEEMGLKGSLEDDDTFALRELDLVFAYWSRPTSQAASPTRTGAPDFRSRYPDDQPPEARGGCEFATTLGQCQNPGALGS